MSEQFPEKKNLKQIQIIRFHFFHISNWQISNHLKTGIEKYKLAFLWRSIWQYLLKLITHTTFEEAIPLLFNLVLCLHMHKLTYVKRYLLFFEF